MAPLLSLRFYPPLSERDGSSVEELARRIEAGTKRELICTAHISSLFHFSNLLCSAIHPANDTQRENKAVGLGLLEEQGWRAKRAYPVNDTQRENKAVGLGLLEEQGWRVKRAYPASNTQRENKAVGLGLLKSLLLEMRIKPFLSDPFHF